MSAGERKQRIIADIVHDFGVQAATEQRPWHGHPGGGLDLRRLPLLPPVPEHGLRRLLRADHVVRAEPQRDLAGAPNSDERYKFDTYTKHVLAKDQTTVQYRDRDEAALYRGAGEPEAADRGEQAADGFDAPSCTYIYLDNELRDHNLFQAICRTNRLDGDDKDYGHIVDYKELFSKVQDAIAVYTSDELDIEACGDDANVVVKDWLEEGKARLDAARGPDLPVRAGEAAAGH